MKKSLIIPILIGATMVACTGKKTVQEQYKELNDSIEAQINRATSIREADSLITAFTNDCFYLVMENIAEQETDSVIYDLYYLLTTDQKQELFEALPAERLQDTTMQQYYQNFQAELLGSAGHPYMDIVSLQPDGNPLALSELIGTADYVLVDFWASWCGPCRRLLPVLKEFYNSYHPSGRLTILGVSCDQDEQAWLKAIADEELPWQQIRDQRQEPYNPCDIYGITSIPTTLLIDRNGTIVLRNPDETELEKVLAGI